MHKIVGVLFLIVSMAAIILPSAIPDLPKSRDPELQKEIERIRQNIIDQDVQIAMDMSGREPRLLAGGSNGFGNLTAILAAAPNSSASVSFLPLATVLFGGPNRGFGGR